MVLITVKFEFMGHVRYFKTEHYDDAQLLAHILKTHEPGANVEIWN